MKVRVSKWLLTVLAIPGVIVILLLSGITIPLDFLDSRLESLASDLLDRTVSINGPVKLKTSLQPSLELGGLTIGNPRNWNVEQGYLVKVQTGKAQLSLPELWRGNVHIKDLEFSGVDLHLITRANQTNNFQFALPHSNQDKKAPEHELSGLDRLMLHDLVVNYVDEISQKQYTLNIAEALGQGKPASPLQFMFSGKLNGNLVTLDFTGGTLKELLNKHESWPINEGHLSLADVSLDITGSLNLANKGKAGYTTLAFEGHSLDAIGDIFDLPLPDIGEFSLASNITLLPGIIQLTTMQLNALHNTLDGELILDLSGERPRLAGDIAVTELTPEIMAAFQEDDTEKQNNNEPGKLISAELPWKRLQLVDTDLQFQAGSINMGELQINDLKGVISLVDGDLILPVSMAMMALPLKGQLEISTSNPVPTISADISSPGANLNPLFELFPDKLPLHGQLGALSFKSRSMGRTFDELIKKVDVELNLGPTTINTDSMTILATETLSLERSHDQLFSISATGELLDRPMSLNTTIGKADASSNYTGSALHVDIRACDTALLLDGGMIDEAQELSAFALKLEGEKLCGFLGPAEQFMGKEFSFATAVTGSLNNERFMVEVETMKLGDINVNGRMNLTSDEDGEPLISGVIHSDRFDLDHFLHRRDTGKDKTVQETSPQTAAEQIPAEQTPLEYKIEIVKNLLAMEILPIKKFLTTNVHLELELDELITELMSVSDIKLTLEAEKGRLKHSPFQARIGGSLFTGSAAIDTTTTVPLAHLDLSTDDFKLPELLREFNISQAPDLSAEHVGLELSFKGKTLQEMLSRADYLAELRNGKVILARESQIPLVVKLEQLDYVSSPEQPAALSADGTVNNLSLALEMTGDGVFAKGSDKPVVISGHAKLADTRVEVDGQINRKQDQGESFHLNMVLSGNQMDSLNEVLSINMPPLGPYQIKGSLASKNDYSFGLYDMGVQVGESNLNGELIVSGPKDKETETPHKPNIQTRLNAQSIQLDDFQFGDWSPLVGHKPDPEQNEPNEPLKDQNDNRLYNILSADIAKKVNGSLDLQVQQVLSGVDNLGNGQLNARLEDGRYVMDGLQLALPGGTIDIAGALQPEHDKIDAELMMVIKRFDYGILARRTKPDSTLKGSLNLSLDLNSQAGNPMQLKENVNGQFRIGIVPEEYEAKTLDLWAINIITAALPALLKGNKSVVNCLAGNFTLEDGIIRPDVFVIDTSKIRVRGAGMVNFKTDEINFHLKPTPKSAQFFSLATPISVSGTILKPHIDVPTANIIGTIFRQAFSVVTVPLQWLFTDNLEVDGTKVCSAAMQWVDENSVGSEEKATPLKTNDSNSIQQ